MRSINRVWWGLLFSMSFCSSASMGYAALAEKVVLDNGLTLLVATRSTLPMVAIQALIKAGNIVEPAEKAGVANLTVELLPQGTTSRSAVDISQTIDFVGGELSVDGERDYVTLELRILKKDLDTALALLADLLQAPRFDPTELERKRQEILAALRKTEDEPGEVASRAFRALLFGSHPYGRPIEGTAETLTQITREDIQQFYHTYYHPNRVILAMVGDITPEEAKTKGEQFFGTWAPGSPLLEELPPSAEPVLPLVKKIDKPLSQATVLLGHKGISRDNPDYYALTVMNYILGSGGFSSRLLDTLREQHGLVYSVYSQFQTGKYPEAFWINLETRNRAVNLAIELIRNEMHTMQETLVSSEELQGAQDYLIGSFPFRIDTNQELATLLPLLEFYHLGLDYAVQYPRLIKEVSREEVQRVAQHYLHPDHYLLVIVGNQQEIE